MIRRFSIARLMALVAAAALNLAASAAINRFAGLTGLYLCGPILLCVQWGFYRSFAGTSPVRPFWLCFATAGLTVTVTLFWAYLLYPPTHILLFRAYTCSWDAIARVDPGLFDAAWSYKGLRVGAFTLSFFVPQATLCLVVGVLGQAAARLDMRRPAQAGPQPAA